MYMTMAGGRDEMLEAVILEEVKKAI